MAVKLGASLDTASVARTAARLRGLSRLAANAVNTTAREARDESTDRITRHLNLRDQYVRAKFSLRRASPARPTAVVSAVDAPVQVRQYDARQEFGDGGKRAGISVQVLRGGPRRTLRSAFFAPLRGGNGIGVVGRKTAARYPLRVLYAPSPGQMFRTITPEMTGPLMRRLSNALLAQIDSVFTDVTVSG